MLLNRLELQGFKSFPDKISLDLGHRITAIVGPNGSGKSNITDAVRWLLGERDARNLRGGKGEDLIFAGTEARPRLGLAQATIYFNNVSGFFPLDFREVSIGRRLNRDGASKFFVNKGEVRLKDLAQMLAKVKLGSRGLTIINQGESDVFIKADPLERRAMIEEILGLKEYQLKRTEAIKRLEITSFNLEKAKSLIEELKPHLRSLRRQAARYEGREVLAKELHELENSFYGNRLGRLEKELKELNSKERQLKEAMKRQEMILEKAESELEKVSRGEPQALKEIEEIQIRRDKLFSRRLELEKKVSKLEVQLEFLRNNSNGEIQEFSKTIERIQRLVKALLEENEINKLKAGIKRISELVEACLKPHRSPQTANLTKEHQGLVKELSLLEKEAEIFVDKENKQKQLLQGFTDNFRESYALVEKERKKLEKLREEENGILLSKERVETKLSDLKEELAQIGLDFEKLEEARISEPAFAEAASAGKEEEGLKRMFKLRSLLAGIGEIDEAIIKEAQETEKRYRFLTDQTADLEKAVADLKSLIQELDQKISGEFNAAVKKINSELAKLMKLIFGGGKARLLILQPDNLKSESGNEEAAENSQSKKLVEDNNGGIEVEVVLPKKKIKGLEVLSGGERSLVSIAALFALISISPPPFLVLDEVDAALDEDNARRFGRILQDFTQKTQFVIITHNRITMEIADVLYGVTMSPDGASKIVSLKLS